MASGLRQEMSAISNSEAEEGGGMQQQQSSTSNNAYGTFSVRTGTEGEGDDDWENIKKEYAQSKSVVSVIKRLPPYTLPSCIGLSFIMIIVCVIFWAVGQAGQGGGSGPAAPLAHAQAPQPASTAVEGGIPQLTAAQKEEVKRLAKAQAAKLAAVEIAQQEKKATEAKAEAEARRRERRREIAAVLTAQPMDSPIVQRAVHKGQQQENAYMYDRQRVIVAEQNLIPLQSTVAAKQAQYNTEHAQEESWRADIQRERGLMQDAENSRHDVAERLAQLKVLGRRESSNMPALRWKMVQVANKEETAIQNAQRFRQLAAQSKSQLGETVEAEAEDSAAIVQERAYAAAQRAQSAALLSQAGATVSTTDALERKIASLTPIVTDLQSAYLHEEKQKINEGLIVQDQRREAARTKLNKYIREREYLEELPKSPAHTAELQAIAEKLSKAQAYLGKLYSDEETDKQDLREKVQNDELKSGLYVRFQEKQAALGSAQAQLNEVTTTANEERAQAQVDSNNAQAAEARVSRTLNTNSLLAHSERRLRVKEKVFKQEVIQQARIAQKMALRSAHLKQKLAKAQKTLRQETMKGEEYVARVVARQHQKAKYMQKLNREEQAFQQEQLLDHADLQQVQGAELQLQAAQQVVQDLKRQANLDKALIWKDEMQVQQMRRQQEEAEIAAQEQASAQAQGPGAVVAAGAGAGGRGRGESPYLIAKNNVVQAAVQAQIQQQEQGGGPPLAGANPAPAGGSPPPAGASLSQVAAGIAGVAGGFPQQVGTTTPQVAQGNPPAQTGGNPHPPPLAAGGSIPS